jgi:allantoin racemase
MQILYIFPRTTPDPAEAALEHRRRRAILQSAASSGTTIDIRELDGCPPAIESIRDAYAVAPGIIALAEELQDQYAAMIVGCFGDPAVDGAIEGTQIPIVGCALPAMATALLLGSRFAVLSPSVSSAEHMRTQVMSAGLLDRYAGSVSVGIGVREFARDPETTLSVVVDAGRKAMDLGGEVLILGCMSLAFAGVSGMVQERLGIPVINPIHTAVRSAEMLVSAGLSPSRRFAGTNAADSFSVARHEVA